MDTFLGRGDSAATLQVGGPDAGTQIAQLLTTPSVPAPFTTNAQFLYGNVLQFADVTGISVGNSVIDVTEPGAFSVVGVTVTNVDSGLNQVTLSSYTNGYRGDTFRFGVSNDKTLLNIVGGKLGFGTVPSSVAIGQTVTAVTHPSAIPGGTTVTGFDSATLTGVTFVLLNNAIDGTVYGGPGSVHETIQFTSTNFAAANFTIAPGRSTGSGTPGKLLLQGAPAGGSGSSVNARQTYLTIDPAATFPTAIASKTSIDAGGASTEQLRFLPNSGLAGGLGMVNGGGSIGVFTDGSAVLALQPSGVVIRSDALFNFSATTDPFSTIDTAISRTAAGKIAVGNGTGGNASGTVKLTTVDFNADASISLSAANTLSFTGASLGYQFDALAAPTTNDGAALGSTSLKWSDLFLASGAVINFNSGDLTATHSSGAITFTQNAVVNGIYNFNANSSTTNGGQVFGINTGTNTGTTIGLFVGGDAAVALMYNLQNTNSGAGNTAQRLLVTGTGDTYLNFSLLNGSGIDWAIGIDNSDSDKLKICQGTSPSAGAATELLSATTTLDATWGGFLKSKSALGGIGYATGAGGTVTQLTSKATGVTLAKVSGQITTFNDALANATEVSFTVTATGAVAATDGVVVNHKSGGTLGAYVVQAHTIAADSYKVSIRNVSGGSLSEALVLTVNVIKGVTS
jgi:hypothetical protein